MATLRQTFKHEYRTWRGMRDRCLCKTNTAYKYYGGRGIIICSSWLESFANFINDMGERPEPKNYYTIDRVDNNGNYEPSNCRWATRSTQQNNKSLQKRYVQCLVCSESIYEPKGQFNSRKVCSFKCLGVYMQNKEPIDCFVCGKSFAITPSKKRRGVNCCSYRCGTIKRTKKLVHNYSKTCKVHGVLPMELIFCKTRKNGAVHPECRLCQREQMKKRKLSQASV